MADMADIQRRDKVGEAHTQGVGLHENIVGFDAAVRNTGVVYDLQSICQRAGE